MQTVSPATFSTHSCQQWETVNNVVKILAYAISRPYTKGDSDVISMPAGFRRHLVGKTFINIFTVIALKYALGQDSDYTDIFINQRIECYLNNTITLRPLTSHIMPCSGVKEGRH